jgi:AbrB family looped-hinge helix DNA binding protein
MSHYVARVTSKGQVTLPSGLRKQLCIQDGDSVTFTVTDQTVVFEKNQHTVESVRGMFPALPGVETGDFDDLIEEAMSDHASWVVDRMRRGLE